MRVALSSLAAIAVLALQPISAQAACTTGRCTDPTAVENVRSLIAAACDCAGGTSHKKYLKCAKEVVKAAVRDASLPKECKAGVWGCEVASNCGMPEAAVCCVARKGKVKAKLAKRSGQCSGGGTMCSGAMSLAEACTADATCREPRRRLRAFRSIQKVFDTSCAIASCHSAFARKGGLVLDAEDVSYQSLVGRPSDLDAAGGMPRVDPGHPENSFLMKKLRGEGPGDSMPQGAPPLPSVVIDMIEQWIARGAHTTAAECTPGTAPSVCDAEETPIGDYVWKPEEALAPPPATDGIQLYVPPKDVVPGKEWETCFAFRPNWADVAAQSGYVGGALPTIKEQLYRMHPGSHHLLLYAYFGQHPEDFKKVGEFFDCFAATCLNPDECPEDINVKLPIGGTQVAGTHYEVDYPEGVGIPVLGPNTVLIANLHFTNPFQPPQPIYGEAWLNLYFAKQGETKAILDGIFAINYSDLFIEPYATRTISRIWQPRGMLSRQPVDAAVFQLFGHFHKRGVEFKIDVVKDGHCSGNTDAACGRDDDCHAGQTCNRGPNAEDSTIYYTTSWDHAPVVNYPKPYLLVNRDEGLRWTCTHTNGVLGDPTRPPKKCTEGCKSCGWDEASRTCIFQQGIDLGFQQPPAHVYAENEPMPVVFGELADDDMCNMFGYFLNQADLPKLP